MILQTIDWSIVIICFILSLIIGLAVTRRAGSSTAKFLLLVLIEFMENKP